MAHISLEELLKKTDNSIYSLVVLASKRAAEISDGQSKLVEVDSSLKPGSIALREIAEGKVSCKKPGKK